MTNFLKIVSLLMTCATLGAQSPLAHTAPLDWPEEDLSGRMMDGAHRFVEKQIAQARTNQSRFWKPGGASVMENRKRLREIIGAEDLRDSPWMERFGDDDSPALVAETARYRIYQVR